MKVAPLADREAINAILCSAAIAPKIRHDGREPGYIDHPLARYHGAWVEEQLVGVFLAVRFSRWEIEAHVALLPAWLKHGRALARMFLAGCFTDAEVGRVTAYVMDTLPTAANFCRKLGFVNEGRRRNACQIDGEWRDVLIFGMTRQDWVLQQDAPWRKVLTAE